MKEDNAYQRQPQEVGVGVFECEHDCNDGTGWMECECVALDPRIDWAFRCCCRSAETDAKNIYFAYHSNDKNHKQQTANHDDKRTTGEEK